MIDQIRNLGYDVIESFHQDEPEPLTIYRIEGFGLSVLVRGDDTARLKDILDSKAHNERVLQMEETP